MPAANVADPQLPTFTDARQAVEERAASVSPTDLEMFSLLDALGLVLAEDLLADRDFPPFPRSTRDGFAVRSEEVVKAPVELRCIGELRAGASEEQSHIRVGRGETVEIMTGAPVPHGADAVLMVEYTT